MRLLSWVVAGALSLLIGGVGQRGLCQNGPVDTRSAKVTVIAVDILGHPLSNTDVYSFLDEEGREKVGLFHRDRATAVPYGKYRISVQANGGFRESTFDITVSAPEVRVTAPLAWYGVDNTVTTGRFRGKIVGQVPKQSAPWCKASGLYSRDHFESVVSQTERAFDFGDVPAGLYVLTCVAERKVVALEVVRIAADAEPITINYSPIRDLDDPR
jgi:hypothetical protein